MGGHCMKVSIQIIQPIENHLDEWDDWVDAFELLGGHAEDYDPEHQVVSLMVDISDIEMDYEINGGMFPHEIWGAIHMIEETEITVRSCKWGNYDVLNDEEVCYLWEEKF
jgi:hypothetical protein